MTSENTQQSPQVRPLAQAQSSVQVQSPAQLSPTKVNKVDVRFGFSYAIEELNHGERVTKKEWNDPEYWLEVRNGRLQIHKPDGKYYDLIVTDGDMLGTDLTTI